MTTTGTCAADLARRHTEAVLTARRELVTGPGRWSDTGQGLCSGSAVDVFVVGTTGGAGGGAADSGPVHGVES
ncbi:hypothetical protein [Streptomyces phytophilus]|uniref:hypothetical protein n=1 Tax=Streptomyces phytophilus TaxID=722715 RepID=UPI0015F114A4|nr:hypothetical protein [Streptomyces phytophilus]